MMKETTVTTEELIAQAIGLGRSAAARARQHCLGGTSHTAGLANRALASHACGKGLDEREDTGIDLILELFADDICRETTGTTIRLLEPRRSSDEDCVIWAEVPVRTERGHALQEVQAQFCTYVDLRKQVRDRVLAEKYLLSNLSL